MKVSIERQFHGYRNGHQLLNGSINLTRQDQDLIDRLSDISGPLRPGEGFDPYVTAYPLPSGLYFVVAKTWQDLSAPRAGCVLTHSILIPPAVWGDLESVNVLFELLEPFPKDGPYPLAGDVNISSQSLPPIEYENEISLVEALFLEDRRPIVTFHTAGAYSVAVRLLSAFWPSLRRGFSVCTYSLGPRTINGRSFDLMFAPRHSRSRFSEWKGRVIDGATVRPDSAEHRWSRMAAERVFVSDPPDLLSLDKIGALSPEGHSEEGAFRLALLWNELLEKAESSPTAALGMLDILRALGRTAATDLLDFLPVMIRAVHLAVDTYPDSEAMRYLLTFVGKFPMRRPPVELLNVVHQGLVRLASSNRRLAIMTLQQTESQGALQSALVLGALGDGLSQAYSGQVRPFEVRALSNETNMRLVAYSKKWAQFVLKLSSLPASELDLEWLALLIQQMPEDLFVKSRRNVIPVLALEAQSPILRALLNRSTGEQVLRIANAIRLSTDFRIDEFDRLLVEAARREGVVDALRELALSVQFAKDLRLFLTLVLVPSEQDVRWVLRLEGKWTSERSRLLKELFERSSDSELYKIVSGPLCTDVLQILATNLRGNGNVIARVLIASERPLANLWGLARSVFPFINARLRSALGWKMLKELLSSGPLDFIEIYGRELLEGLDLASGVKELIEVALQRSIDSTRVDANLQLLSTITGSLHRSLLNEIEVISDQLISESGRELLPRTISNLSQLIRESGTVNPYGQLRSAEKVLSYAFARKDQPVSELVVASFPIVYARLKDGQDAPNLIAFLFTDWDRCKTARKDITKAFLHSGWPSVDLVRAVAPTGELPHILGEIIGSRSGDHFLSTLRREVESLDSTNRKIVEEMLKPVFQNLGSHASTNSH